MVGYSPNPASHGDVLKSSWKINYSKPKGQPDPVKQHREGPTFGCSTLRSGAFFDPVKQSN